MDMKTSTDIYGTYSMNLNMELTWTRIWTWTWTNIGLFHPFILIRQTKHFGRETRLLRRTTPFSLFYVHSMRQVLWPPLPHPRKIIEQLWLIAHQSIMFLHFRVKNTVPVAPPPPSLFVCGKSMPKRLKDSVNPCIVWTIWHIGVRVQSIKPSSVIIWAEWLWCTPKDLSSREPADSSSHIRYAFLTKQIKMKDDVTEEWGEVVLTWRNSASVFVYTTVYLA
jgi:hypothetical protein